MYPILRTFIGSIFLVSSLGKLLSPYQNFLYVVQAYQFLPSWGEVVVAQVFPWIELIVGVFVLLGLWTPWALRGALVLFAVFVVVVGQALIRNLPLESCGWPERLQPVAQHQHRNVHDLHAVLPASGSGGV